MDPLNCYICNNTSMFYCKNIYKLSSKHSETPICDFIVKFLGKETSRLCHEENIVCSDCLSKIDEYDLACITVERVERELRDTLLHTESIYASEPVFVEILERDVDDDTDDCDKIRLLKIELALPDSDANCRLINGEEMEKTRCGLIDSQTATQPETESSNAFENQKTTPANRRNELAVVDRRPKLRQVKKEKVIFNCSQCPVKFSSKSELKQHEKVHAQIELFTCEICGLATKTAAGLSRHKQLHANGEPFECAICNKVFKKKNSLARHMRIHTGEKFYQCDKCGVEFIHKSSFRMHIMAHDDIREKKCPHCTLSFRSTSHLNRHLRIHTGAKPYSCPECGQRFAQRYNMMVHLRIHKGISRNVEKNHMCSICGIAFVRAQKLTEHYRKAHETIPHTVVGGPSAATAAAAAVAANAADQVT